MIQPNPSALCLTVHPGPVLRPGDSEWEKVGPESDPTLKLRTSWSIGGVGFHVEATRVRRDHDVQVVDTRSDGPDENPYFVEDFEDLTSTLVPDGGFSTLKLDGSEYVLFIFPFSP